MNQYSFSSFKNNNSINYNESISQSLQLKLRKLIEQLPYHCELFFRGIESTTSIKTRVAYAFDLRVFFYYLTNEIDIFSSLTPKNFTTEEIEKITPIHIEKFLEYLTLYSLPHYKDSSSMITYSNSNEGKARKLSSLRSFFKYLFKKQIIKTNPALLVDMPKIHEKPIIRLEVDEVANLLDLVENGNTLTKVEKRYHKYTKNRDLALLILLLGTGIRVSECVGLDISDFDFSINGFKITRKGGNQEILYFSDEVAHVLNQYLLERNTIKPKIGHEDALFLSLQKKRISVSSVQKLVKKYTKKVTPLKNISPHKLRSTYGTNLYRETGDIYIVADVLGHKDVNTTKKHYAAISDLQKRKAAKMIKLREE
ncbi:tyrosine-type recombinase/integrase [Garciella nitratireducens]|uniref:Site-specific recombinase XerD n=1 Tax=Garciella nitratireducens DSM 15102 TaxID=1121911 RepID=A0A1T4JVR3_9FIRM|nr:tyrosine-type recombinase/integrase [Garciella nitratireducens]RBP45610.1 site-specific recombinase XerD [Garciella nitratireducens]SJZ34248.1 Site-specific recombinase XerD [Garciella nitratireducens DSM 15102]